MNARLAGTLAVAALVALGTWAVAWWAVVPVALAAGWFSGGRLGWIRIGLGALAGWAALLLVDALGGRLGVLAGEMGGILHVPGLVLVGVSLVVPAVLGMCAGWLGAELGRRRSTDRTVLP